MAVTRKGSTIHMDADGDTVNWPVVVQALHAEGNLTFSDADGNFMFDTGTNRCCITFPQGLPFPNGIQVNGASINVVLFLQ